MKYIVFKMIYIVQRSYKFDFRFLVVKVKMLVVYLYNLVFIE